MQGVSLGLLTQSLSEDLSCLELTCCPQITFAGTTIWKSLSVVCLNGCARCASDAGLKQIAARCPRLTTLTLFRAETECRSAVTKAGLIALAEGCLDIRYVALSECFDIDDAALLTFCKKCPHITTILLEGSGMPTMGGGLKLLCAFPTLFLLTIRRWANATSACLYNGVVEELYRSNTREIAELAWACAMLGFHDVGLVDVIISHVQRDYASLDREAIMKIGWACRRLHREMPIISPADEEMNESSPEDRRVRREKATEVLRAFLSRLPRGV